MADTTQSEQLEKRAPDAPELDPIADRSMSGPLLISSLLLVVTLLWSLYDEVVGQRPWKGYQKDFVSRYGEYLETAKARQGKSEREVKQSPEYQELHQAYLAEKETADAQTGPIDAQVKRIDDKITAVTEPFQNVRSWIVAKTYQLEVTESESSKNSIRAEIEEKRQAPVKFEMPNDAGQIEKQSMSFTDLENLYNSLRDEKARLLADRVLITQPRDAAQKKRDEYMQDHLGGLTAEQVGGLEKKVEDFKFEIKQINVGGVVIDRCESCHLGVREPIKLTKKEMFWTGDDPDNDAAAAAFVSHPNKELFKTHDPDRFGCSTCHGGNGRGTTSVEKAHGRYEHWLWPMYYKENVEAGCNQCHNRDRVLQGSDVLNRGKNLFQVRGCAGCHRYEAFDREADALSNARQSMKTLELDRDDRRREITQTSAAADTAATDEEATQLRRKVEALRQMISQVDARIDEFDVQAKYLMQDVKKIGPNLKEIKAKLRKDWIPVWLADPQAFRPGTKMPTFRLDDDEIKAVSAFLWQSALDVKLPSQAQGDAGHGKELFKTLGCMGCHSINGQAIDMGDGVIGGDFAANLSRVGEKANYDYIVRWVHNPRQRLAPYSPSQKRDLTPADYKKKNLPFVFDDDHSKSPVDGRELQIQNMTVMPNFRLSDQDARDIATFLMAQKRPGVVEYRSASFLDDTGLLSRGKQLVQRYGCAACHEIKGLEDEQRIGTELTLEGSKPIERLDFALLQQPAMQGKDPITGAEIKREGREGWYDHKGFFENKLRSPGIYDRGKVKSPDERLRMPLIYLPDSDVTALTTFLLGSVETNLPESLRYNPGGGKKAVQDGWWIVQKYNCMGCHNVLVGQESVLMGLPMYQSADGKEQLPPRLTSEGARVNPDWLLRFLKDPSQATQAERAALAQAVSGHAQAGGDDWTESLGLHAQPGANHNGVRRYLKARMPTFNFSPNELQALVNFFMGASSQAQPYIPERLDPLAADEQGMARALFSSNAAPCLKCHMTGDPAHDARATAPNFLLAPERLKPAWTRRWLLDPQLISPGTSMPSELFKRDQGHERWVFNGPTPPAFQTYEKDHVDLLVRYMFQISPDEQKRLGTGGGAPSAPAASGAGNKTAATARNSGRANGRGPIAAIRAP